MDMEKSVVIAGVCKVGGGGRGYGGINGIEIN